MVKNLVNVPRGDLMDAVIEAEKPGAVESEVTMKRIGVPRQGEQTQG
jgi:hypothetical protein